MSELPGAPDESATIEVVRRMREGDESAWQELYRLYHDKLLLAIRRRLGQRLRSVLQTEDIFQSVALEAFRDLPAYELRGKGSFKAWLFRIVQNKIRDRADYFDAQKRRGTVPVTDSRTPAPWSLSDNK